MFEREVEPDTVWFHIITTTAIITTTIAIAIIIIIIIITICTPFLLILSAIGHYSLKSARET